MNLYLKNTALLACIVLVAMMSDCLKDNPQTKNLKHPDFRDSVMGSYSCIEHNYFGSIQYYYDSIIGPATLTVIKASDDSSLLINGETFTYNYSSTSQTLVYSGYNPNSLQTDALNFILSRDSIWLQQPFYPHVSYTEYYYYTGHKQ